MKKLLCALICAAALLTCVALADTPPDGTASYNGVDIYHGSNVLDFAALKASGHADFAWIKRSEGESWQDPKYDAYVAGCKAAGIKWGPYHFLRLYSADSAQRQADTYWSRIKGTGYTVLPAVDVESHDGQDTAAGMRACIRAFVDEFYRVAGFKPVLYTYTAYANDYLHGDFSDCPLWLADYRGYSGDVDGWKSWVAWQYSGDTARVAGVDNPTDLDRGTAGIFIQAAVSVHRSDYPYIARVRRGNNSQRTVRAAATWSGRAIGTIRVGERYEIMGPVDKNGWVKIGLAGRVIGYASAACF